MTTNNMMNTAAVDADMTMTDIPIRTITTTTNMMNTAAVDPSMIITGIPMRTITTTTNTMNTVTAAASMTTDMRNPITRLVILRTVSVNCATRMRNTAISAARVLQTASVICQMPTVKRKSIS